MSGSASGTGGRRALDRGAGGLGVGAWSAAVCAIALAIAGAVGLAVGQPWLFPSLGPTLMVLAETPRQPAARPRNVLVGHLVGVGAGYLALVVTGLTDAPTVLAEGISGPRIVAACLSVGLTALVLQAVHCPHPPAGATTLVVSLGLLRQPSQLLTIVLAVALVTGVAAVLGALAGVRREGVPAAPRG